MGSVHNDLHTWAFRARKQGLSTIEIDLETADRAVEKIVELSNRVMDLEAALRAQPPAREEAQPVGMRVHLVRGKNYGNLTIRHWASIGGLTEGEHVLFTTPPAPEAEKLRVDAERYRFLRSRDPGPDGELPPQGPFIGQVPDNLILTEDDADAAIDEALAALQQEGRP